MSESGVRSDDELYPETCSARCLTAGPGCCRWRLLFSWRDCCRPGWPRPDPTPLCRSRPRGPSTSGTSSGEPGPAIHLKPPRRTRFAEGDHHGSGSETRQRTRGGPRQRAAEVKNQGGERRKPQRPRRHHLIPGQPKPPSASRSRAPAPNLTKPRPRSPCTDPGVDWRPNRGQQLPPSAIWSTRTICASMRLKSSSPTPPPTSS